VRLLVRPDIHGPRNLRREASPNLLLGVAFKEEDDRRSQRSPQSSQHVEAASAPQPRQQAPQQSEPQSMERREPIPVAAMSATDLSRNPMIAGPRYW
jgi:hypothetical protein